MRPIHSTPGANTTYEKQYYNYEDNDVAQTGVYYYRLKQIDYDGLFSYSKTIAVYHENRAIVVNTFPNPTKEILNVSFDNTYANSTIDLKLFSARGELVYNQTINANQSQMATINTSQFATGVYFIECVTASTRIIKKIVIKE